MAKSFTWTEKSVRWILAKIKGIRKEKNVVLPLSGWVDGQQTVSVPGVTAASSVFVGGDLGSEPEYSSCGVYCSAQGDGTLTFSCCFVPSADVVADAIIFT